MPLEQKKEEKVLHQDYRKDWRTDEEFQADIKKAHKIESDIMDAFVRHLELTYPDSKFVVEDNGIDNSGEVLDLKDVDMRADYKVNGKLLEIKYNNNHMDEFRFKKSQLESYIEQNATVLWVNGWDKEEPVWTLMNVKDLKEIKKTRQPFKYKYWGFKLCYNIKAYNYEWSTFKGLYKE